MSYKAPKHRLAGFQKYARNIRRVIAYSFWVRRRPWHVKNSA